MPQRAEKPPSRYWRQTRRITRALLAVWLLVSLLATYFAREIDFAFFGWRFSFWLGAQGTLLVFLGIVVVYVWAMQRLERREDAAAPASTLPPGPPPPAGRPPPQRP